MGKLEDIVCGILWVSFGGGLAYHSYAHSQEIISPVVGYCYAILLDLGGIYLIFSGLKKIKDEKKL